MRTRGRILLTLGLSTAVLGLAGGAAAARPASGVARPGGGSGPAGPSVATEAKPGSAVEVSAFSMEPVVLTGADFPRWTSGPEVTARAPQAPTDYEVYDYSTALPGGLRSDCYQTQPSPDVNGSTDSSHGDHNC